MLKNISQDQIFYNQKPRKLIKINIQQDQHYNQYKGQFIQVQSVTHHQFKNKIHENQQEDIKFINLDQQKKRNANIFIQIKKQQQKTKKIGNQLIKKSTKNDEVIENKQQINNKSKLKSQQLKKILQINKVNQPKNKINNNGLSNWQKFKNNTNSTQIKNHKNISYEFAAIDCEFVRHNQQQLLARISIVSENGQCIYDSYVHPEKLITDYVNDISGITYAHIKNAPKINQVINKVKRILLNKIIVGHTVWKDIQVCGLKSWKGYKYLVDISEYIDFKQKNGKLISLKNLSLKHLGKKIQTGIHSSVQDAQATMNLFKLRKKEILKQLKIIL